MESLDALLAREERYQCTDYFQSRPLSAVLPSAALLSMLEECASLVTDTSRTRCATPTKNLASPPSSLSAPPSPTSTLPHHKYALRAKPPTVQKATQDFVDWRKQMVNWALVVVENFNIDKETLAVAFNLLDRYVAIEKQQAGAPAISREDFQLFAMTSLYIAVKMLEPYPKKISVEGLIVMSRGFYSEQDVVLTEQHILAALKWRINPPSVVCFSRMFLECLDDGASIQAVQDLERICARRAEAVVLDHFFVPLKDSIIALACVTHAAQTAGLSHDKLKALAKDFKHVCSGDVSTFGAVLKKLDQLC